MQVIDIRNSKLRVMRSLNVYLVSLIKKNLAKYITVNCNSNYNYHSRATNYENSPWILIAMVERLRVEEIDRSLL